MCPSVEEAIIGIQVRKSKACAEVLNDKSLESQIPASEKNGKHDVYLGG